MFSWKMTVLANIVARYSTTTKSPKKRQRPEASATSIDSNKGGDLSVSTETDDVEPPAKKQRFDIFKDFFDDDAVGAIPPADATASASSNGYASMWFYGEPAPPSAPTATPQ